LESGEKKVCPVCDSLIDIKAAKCKFCKTDLTLFDIDSDGLLDVDKIKVNNRKSIDDLLASIVEEKAEPEIIEEIKTIAKNDTAPEEVEVVRFECPACGSEVDEKATVCPGCGVSFAEEAVEQFECPVCGSPVSSEASECPACGVHFEESKTEETAEKEEDLLSLQGEGIPEPKRMEVEEIEGLEEPIVEEEVKEVEVPVEKKAVSLVERMMALRKLRAEELKIPGVEDRKALYKELPNLVNEVKPMLLSAKRFGIDIGQSKELINKAIASGKKKNIEEAVSFVRESKRALQDAFTLQIAERIDSFYDEVRKAKEAGNDLSSSEKYLEEAIAYLEKEDFEGSIERLQRAREEFERTAGGYKNAKDALNSAESLVQDAKAFNMNIQEAERLLNQGREALFKRDWDVAVLCANHSKERIMKDLPEFLSKEMKKARNVLLDMKMKGADLTKPINILKEASISMRKQEYGEAIKYLRTFKKEVEF